MVLWVGTALVAIPIKNRFNGCSSRDYSKAIPIKDRFNGSTNTGTAFSATWIRIRLMVAVWSARPCFYSFLHFFMVFRTTCLPGKKARQTSNGVFTPLWEKQTTTIWLYEQFPLFCGNRQIHKLQSLYNLVCPVALPPFQQQHAVGNKATGKMPVWIFQPTLLKLPGQ